MPPDFAAEVAGLGLDLDAETLERFRVYRDRMAQAAREFNLTAVRQPAEIERRHFLESLAFGRLLAERGLLADGTRIIDIGTGAGLPGLPLKLAWPRLRLTLVEPIGKRCRFLEAVVKELSLDMVEVAQGRAETLARDPAHREAYDLAVARAVAALPVLAEYALPFLKMGGRLAATKGSGARDEIESAGRALEELGGSLEDTASFRPPRGVAQTVIFVRKQALTPERYPRRVGIPTKRPL